MLAEITEGHPFSRSLSDQPAGRVGEEDLSAVTSSAYPSRSVHVDAFVSGFKARLAGMKPHSDLDRCLIGPRMPLQGLLCAHRRGHSFLCAREYREECVPLAVHFLTAVFLDGGPEESAVLFQDFRIPPVAKALEQLGGPLDVGEEKGDRPGHQAGHEPPPLAIEVRHRPRPRVHVRRITSALLGTGRPSARKSPSSSPCCSECCRHSARRARGWVRIALIVAIAAVAALGPALAPRSARDAECRLGRHLPRLLLCTPADRIES